MSSRPVRTTCTLLVGLALGCGGPARPATEPPATEPATSGATTSGDAPPVASDPRLTLGAVSWQLFTPMRIDETGTLFQGSSRGGTLTADGRLLTTHGTVAARLDDDGWILLEEQRSPLRIVGARVIEVRTPSDGDASDNDADASMMRIEGDELVVGSGDEEERLPIVGMRPELTPAVLFASAVAMAGMARAFQH